MRAFLRWLAGGRPMKPIEFRFTDVVSGRDVWLFEDRYGRDWLAYSPWSQFRARVLHPRGAYVKGYSEHNGQ